MSKVVVITGASGGIGAGLARRLGQRGDRVVLAARREKELAAVAGDAGKDPVVVVADVSRRADVDRVRDEALRACGHVDVWINNAGRGINKKVLDLTDEDMDLMFAVNLKSALYGMQAIVPHFQERGRGHVVNVSSMLGRVPFATFRSAYSASKAALGILTSNLRMDLRAAHPDVHVSLVMPGPVATEFFANALGGTPQLPPGMVAQPSEEVVDVILALLDAPAPAPEVYTSPGMQATVAKYYADVGAFEAQLPVRR